MAIIGTHFGERKIFRGRLLPATALALLATVAPTRVQAQAAPQDEAGRFPDGPGKTIVIAKCQDCHDLERVTIPHTRAQWESTVGAMAGRGAHLSPDEIQTVIQYLSANFLKPDSAAQPAKGGSGSTSASYDFSKKPPRGTIRGTVTADQGQVSGFRVTARNFLYRIRYTVYTRDGRYEIPQALPGRYEVYVVEDGYNSPKPAADLSAGGSASVDIAVTKNEQRVLAPSIVAAETLRPTAVQEVSYDELYPPGPARDILERTCIPCHNNDALNRYHRNEQGWRDAIQLMRNGHFFNGESPLGHTQMLAADVDLLAKYLAANFGLNSPNRTLKREWIPRDEQALSKAIFVEYEIPEDMPHPTPIGTGASPFAFDINGKMAVGSEPMQIIHDAFYAKDTGMVWLSTMTASAITSINPREQDPGKRWKFYPLKEHAFANGLAQDSKGHIYFTEVGEMKLGEIDQETGKIREYPAPGIGDLHSIFVDPQDNVWMGAMETSFFYKLDAKTQRMSYWSAPTPDSSIYSMAMDQKGMVWGLGYAPGLVIQFDPATWKFTEYKIPTVPAGNRRMRVRSDGMIWFTETAGHKLAYLDPSTGKFKEYEFPVYNTRPYEVWEDRSQKYMWCTDDYNSALVKLDPLTGKTTYYPLPNLRWSVPKVETEPNNTAWFGSRGPGVSAGAYHFYPEGYSANAPPEP